jgi:hypothetical protein
VSPLAVSLGPKKVIRQPFAEHAVNPLDELRRYDGEEGLSAIDDPRDFDMGDGFALKVALFRVGSVVACQCPVDIDRVCLVALDQVRILAVHRSDQIAYTGAQHRGQTHRQPAGAADQLGR